MKNKHQLIKALEKHRAAIGRERDALRKVVEDYNDLLESCERANEALDDAIQTLSQLA